MCRIRYPLHPQHRIQLSTSAFDRKKRCWATPTPAALARTRSAKDLLNTLSCIYFVPHPIAAAHCSRRPGTTPRFTVTVAAASKVELRAVTSPWHSAPREPPGEPQMACLWCPQAAFRGSGSCKSAFRTRSRSGRAVAILLLRCENLCFRRPLWPRPR